MKVSKLIIMSVLIFAMLFAGANTVQAMNGGNYGNGIGLVDEAIGAIVKGIALTYIDLVDIETARAVALHYLLRVDNKTFEHYYRKTYHQAAMDVPYEVFSYCGVPASMSREEAIGEVSTFSKRRVKSIANGVPNAVVGACFRRIIHDKFQKDLSEGEVREAAIEYARKVTSKINNRF